MSFNRLESNLFRAWRTEIEFDESQIRDRHTPEELQEERENRFRPQIFTNTPANTPEQPSLKKRVVVKLPSLEPKVDLAELLDQNPLTLTRVHPKAVLHPIPEHGRSILNGSPFSIESKYNESLK